MTNDDARVRAQIIALTGTVNAILKAARDRDPALLTGLQVVAEHEITEMTGEGSELQRAAFTYTQDVIFDGV